MIRIMKLMNSISCYRKSIKRRFESKVCGVIVPLRGIRFRNLDRMIKEYYEPLTFSSPNEEIISSPG